MTPDDRAAKIVETLDLFFIDSEGGIDDRATAIRGIAAEIADAIANEYARGALDQQKRCKEHVREAVEKYHSKLTVDTPENRARILKLIADTKAEAYEDAAKIAEDSYCCPCFNTAKEIRARAKEIQ